MDYLKTVVKPNYSYLQLSLKLKKINKNVWTIEREGENVINELQ